jgi:hypothetical protein
VYKILKLVEVLLSAALKKIKKRKKSLNLVGVLLTQRSVELQKVDPRARIVPLLGLLFVLARVGACVW